MRLSSFNLCEVGKEESVVQGYYSGNLGDAVPLKCISALTKTGENINLVWLFWNQSNNNFCWNSLQMRSFSIDNRQSINSITGNLLNFILHKKFSNKSICSCNTWQMHEEFKVILSYFCYHSPDVMKLCLDFRCLRACSILSFS